MSQQLIFHGMSNPTTISSCFLVLLAHSSIKFVIQVNPDIPEAHSLRGWFDNEGKSAESRSLSGIKGPGGRLI